MTKLMKLTCKKGRVHTILDTESALEKTGHWRQPSTRRRRRESCRQIGFRTKTMITNERNIHVVGRTASGTGTGLLPWIIVEGLAPHTSLAALSHVQLDARHPRPTARILGILQRIVSTRMCIFL